ncbi:hypothetical protein M569_00851 [Genlisea aurea]|uniref:O-methyltransferase domain-containing protein n=1 Tax=Genlisea aurea TaxID=192259 RepID=S8D3G7_9LAMI|nr:hypothetical protein M569_00851 [Genlisea aurea]
MELAQGSILPMALKTAVELDLLRVVNQADAAVSASDLAAQLPTTNPAAPTMIDRILRLLAANGVVVCRAVDSENGGVERRYSPTPVSRYFGEGTSLAPHLLLIQDDVILQTWHHLKDAILEGGGEAFRRAYGKHAFEYPSVDPRFNAIFNKAMVSHTTLFMNKLLQKYDGFRGLETLVDVGGGTGIALKRIIDKYPSISGINFDLSHVINEAPPSPGIEHLAGDMFASIPKANAIFMKWICHDWNDEYCIKLLKNCWDALDDGGKVIVVDSIVESEPDGGTVSKGIAAADVLMMAINPGGKERTEVEFRSLAKCIGFKKFEKVCHVYGQWVMELYK